ncbi:branched-chain amino acid transport system II carrier protein [Hutsoniella sourekii]|uniref:branched-chain amino acid transport system II carrier protein n=1 Tax=Hutsoniella sourekii TaxID=87650 RepID=UPI000488A989|nr:branched-chain amino acid transport system II carrier protein [Hutsoniella sourekii]
MKIKMNDILITGLALFAIFFGAGNLIFPPYLGVLSGQDWWKAIGGFLTSDPFFPILGVLVTIYLGGQADDLGKRIHPKFGLVLAGIAILLIGPLFSVPRTGATTHEIFIQSLWPQIPIWVTSLIFFGLTAYLALNPSKVIDNIGKYLTPAILLIILILVITIWLNPSPTLGRNHLEHPFAYGFKEGYQTMDALGASLMASIVMNDLKNRGYQKGAHQIKAGTLVGIVAFILLALVYLALAYAGANVSTAFSFNDGRTDVFNGMVTIILGNGGQLLMGICVALACLTTAIGLTSACSNFFHDASNGRWSYQVICLICVTVEFIISLIGTQQIIVIASSVLNVIYPIVMILILLSVFDRWITYDLTYTGGVIAAGSVGLVQVLANHAPSAVQELVQPLADWTYHLPLSHLGLEWLTPAIGLALMASAFSYFNQRLQY